MNIVYVNPVTTDKEKLKRTIAENLKAAESFRLEKEKLSAALDTVNPSFCLKEESTPSFAEDFTPEFEPAIEPFLVNLASLDKDATDAEIMSYLPTSKDPNYESILLRLKLELLRKKANILEYAEDEEELAIFADDLAQINREKAVLNRLLGLTDEDTLKEDREVKLVFIPASNSEISPKEDLAKVAFEHYENVSALLKGIKTRNYRNYSLNKDFAEVSDAAVRVIFAPLTDSASVILGIMPKKAANPKTIQTTINARVNEYQKVKDQLLRSLPNEEFLNIQFSYEEYLLSTLGEKRKSPEKKKVTKND